MTLDPNRWKYKKRKWTKAEMRAEAIVGFRYTCQYCEGTGDAVKGPDGRSWHLDRVYPGAAGGEYAPDNVTLACSRCNTSKSARDPSENPLWDAVLPLGAILYMRASDSFMEPKH